MSRALLLLAPLALTGCAELEAELATLTASPQELRQQQLDAARQDCTSYGWAPGTPEFAQCVQDVHAQAKDRGAQAAEAYLLSRQKPAQPAFVPMQTRRTTTTNCRPDYLGGMSCTSN